MGREAAIERVGVISDTHGWLDPRAVAAFERERPLAALVHAGDIGASAALLYELEAIAPVTAVLGNCDHVIPGWSLSPLARLTVGGTRMLVVHDLKDVRPLARAYGLTGVEATSLADATDVIIHGHTHIASVTCETAHTPLCVNPGSASQPVPTAGSSVALLEITPGGAVCARVIMLDELGPDERVFAGR